MRVVFLITIFLFFCQPASGKVPQIIIVGDNWCPINCRADDPDKGYMIDVASQALAMAGYELVYQEMPWARAIALARSGDIHGVVGAFKGDAPDFIFPENAILNISPNHLFTLKNNDWQYTGIDSLTNARLGAIVGYDYGDKLNGFIANAQQQTSTKIRLLSGDNAVKRNIQLLLKNRTEVLVESGPVLWYHANQMGVANQLREAGVISAPEPCFIAFSPNRPESKQLAQALDAGRAILEQNNALLPIATRYGLSPLLMQQAPLSNSLDN